MMWIFETYLDSRFPDDDSRLNLPGYNLVGGDNRNNTKRGGVDLYFKESLAVHFVMPPSLKEYLLLEVFFENRKDVVSLHKSPSQTQTQDQFMIFD